MIPKGIQVKEFDFVILCTTLLIGILGVLAILSAAYSGFGSSNGIWNELWMKQLIRLVVALVAMAVVLFVDYRILHGFSYILYGIGFALLLILLLLPEKSGVQRWFMKGAIQPSELAKIILIITLARYLSDMKRISGHLRVFIVAMLMVLAYVVLIFKQPALGYALSLIPIALSMFYIGGINEIYLLMMIIPGIVSASTTIFILYKGWSIASITGVTTVIASFVIYGICVFLAYFLISKTRVRDGKKWVKFISVCVFAGLVIAMVGSGLLKEYQKKRLMVFIDPDSDPRGDGWQIIQSKIAIGSGGLTGQGYLKGTQNRLDFLPAQHTDFIFSVAAEEKGFLGAVFILLLYFALIMRGLKAIDRADDVFGSLLATGVVAMIATQVFMNIGMTLGLMPITGVPLPLMSYGGSSLLATFISIGLLLNVRLKRQ